VIFYTLPYFAISKNHFVAKIRVYREKKEFSPSYSRKAVRWGGFLFSVYSPLPMIKWVLKDCVFCFYPTSLPAHPPLMPVYHVGLGCSLSVTKVVSGFYGQKRSGRQAI